MLEQLKSAGRAFLTATAFAAVVSANIATAQENLVDPYDDADYPGAGAAAVVHVNDPLEPLNRAFFTFNDKFYTWVLNPVSTGYARVLPQPARVGIRNFFSNVATPIRAVNSLLQGDWRESATELERFAVNTTVGVLGFDDAAADRFGIVKKSEDLGQTLGAYGIGSGIYINWPILGPSNLRDTVGMIGDSFLNPWNYAIDSSGARILIKAEDVVNNTSLRLGDYEEFKASAIDPYAAMRDAYEQMRRKKITE